MEAHDYHMSSSSSLLRIYCTSDFYIKYLISTITLLAKIINNIMLQKTKLIFKSKKTSPILFKSNVYIHIGKETHQLRKARMSVWSVKAHLIYKQ